MNTQNNGRTILVIDDEKNIRRFLRVALEAEGYKFFEAINVQEGLAQAAQHRPDVTLLDLGLPNEDGMEFLRRYRDWSLQPVIVITAQDSDKHKVELLDAGADDYLTKPFSAPELLARIRVSLRHADKSNESQPIYEHPAFKVNFLSRSVEVDGSPIKLTATEFQILKILIQHEGKVITQTQLLQAVWGPNSINDTHYLRIYISHLRKKLEGNADASRFIQTEPGVGYKLVR